jgi:head-tail adaptor
MAIQAPSDVHESSGTITRTWATSYNRWASIEPTGGAEGDQFREIEGHASYRIEIGYDTALAAALKGTHRMVQATPARTFDILRIQTDQTGRTITIIANDYAPATTDDGLTYSGTDYDVILRNEQLLESYTEEGINTTRLLPALVRISDFLPGITAQGATCTVNTRTMRIREVIRPQRGDWYKLTLEEEFAE